MEKQELWAMETERGLIKFKTLEWTPMETASKHLVECAVQSDVLQMKDGENKLNICADRNTPTEQNEKNWLPLVIKICSICNMVLAVFLIIAFWICA